MLYFSPRQLPELKEFNLTERAAIVHHALHMMPTPRRWLANIFKLVVLSSLFVLLVNVTGWYWQVLTLLAAGLSYPLLLQPISLNLCRPYLPAAIKQFRLAQKRDLNAVAEESTEHH